MNGYYVGSMGMMTYQQQLNTHANNITNSQTNGYKFDTMVATVYESLQNIRKNDDSGYIGVNPEKVVNVNSPINWSEGSYVMTESGLNMALIEGEENQTTFFVTENQNGRFLTRNGEFEINENRELKTTSGEFVLDVNNEKIIINENIDFGVNRSGILTNTETGEVIASIQLKTVFGDDRSNLFKSENGKFEYMGDINTLNSGEVEVEQGVIETSNVSMASQMVELLNAQKKFQASSKIVTIFDSVYEKAANKLI